MAAAHAATTVDLGTGDGAFVVARAAARPDEFVIGVDANHAALVGASRRSSRPLPNAAFVISAVEALPAEVDGLADQVTIHFPWGPLFDALTGARPDVADRVRRLLRPTGAVRLLVASAPRDGRRTFDPTVAARTLDLELVAARPASIADARDAHSSWGKRLLANPVAGRQAWLVDLRPEGHLAITPDRREARMIGP